MASAASSRRRRFACEGTGALVAQNRHQYVIEIDFVTAELILHREGSSKAKKPKTFPLRAIIKLEKSANDATALRIMLPDSYDKTLWFASEAERGHFESLVHAVLQLGGESAWRDNPDRHGDFEAFLLAQRVRRTARPVLVQDEEHLQDVQWVDGEEVLVVHEHALRADGVVRARGTLLLSTFRVLFRDYRGSGRSSVSVPLGRVASVEAGDQIVLKLKNAHTVRFGLDEAQSTVEAFAYMVRSLAFNEKKDQRKLFAFKAANKRSSGDDEKNVSLLPTLSEEYTRLCISNRFHKVDNRSFELSPTYPSTFYVAYAISEPDLRAVAAHRSRARVPAIVFVHPVSKAPLARCAQPLVGVKGRRCVPDEDLFTAIRTATPGDGDKVLYVLDARPMAAAVGNQIMGKGVEDMAHYTGSQLIFLNIDNIHAIRGAHESLVLWTSGAVDEMRALDDWLRYVRLLIASSVRCARFLESAAVCVHCSDGWDRTSQLTALTMLLLDPYFRTIEGFMVLIEKEWLSFGHQFARRCGHADANASDDQRAPIFLHFMDAVWQLLVQRPTAFEYNEDFLLDIIDNVDACRFGTFLYNSERERAANHVTEQTASLWTWLLRHRERYTNAAFVPVTKSGPLEVSADARSIRLWRRLHLAYFDYDDEADSRTTTTTTVTTTPATPEVAEAETTPKTRVATTRPAAPRRAPPRPPVQQEPRARSDAAVHRTWACAQCTYENSNADPVCAMCGASTPVFVTGSGGGAASSTSSSG